MGIKMMIFGLFSIVAGIGIYIDFEQEEVFPAILRVIIYSIIVYISFM